MNERIAELYRLILRLETIEDCEALFADLNMEGNFEVKEGKMYLSDGLEYGVDETMYELYSVEGNTMTIDKGSTGDDSADFIYPMVFTKK